MLVVVIKTLTGLRFEPAARTLAHCSSHYATSSTFLLETWLVIMCFQTAQVIIHCVIRPRASWHDSFPYRTSWYVYSRLVRISFACSPCLFLPQSLSHRVATGLLGLARYALYYLSYSYPPSSFCPPSLQPSIVIGCPSDRYNDACNLD